MCRRRVSTLTLWVLATGWNKRDINKIFLSQAIRTWRVQKTDHFLGKSEEHGQTADLSTHFKSIWNSKNHEKSWKKADKTRIRPGRKWTQKTTRIILVPMSTHFGHKCVAWTIEDEPEAITDHHEIYDAVILKRAFGAWKPYIKRRFWNCSRDELWSKSCNWCISDINGIKISIKPSFIHVVES